jgi:hypothetical protein
MSVSVLVALGAKSYEILSRIITQSAPPLDVMDLKIFHAPAQLATPSISFQNFPAESAVIFGLKPQAWSSCSDFFQSVPCTSSSSCFRCGFGSAMTSRIRQGKRASWLPVSKLTPARKSAQIISRQ